jgi:cysteinyl-tRNA synthetase
MLRLTNTLTKKKEDFIPLYKDEVKIYHCGPTVYWNQHIGNMRGMLMGDLLRRSLLYLGYNVRYVRNYTDFGHLTSDADEGEDKMEKAAKREQLDPQKIADKYIEQFESDTKALNILDPTIKARATNYLQEMIDMVSTLLEKGYAYETPKAIYFDVSKFKNYTALSGQNLELNQAGAGTGTVSDPEKRNPQDFALWFFKTGAHKNALQFWPSPFRSSEVENGFGFPGWHIECSAMVKKELGKSIDIHFGGVEHVPVHHTNEIAQSESANGVRFVNYWLHNEHLTLNDKKIAKSDGNFILLSEITKKGYDPMHLRYLFLQSHYRSKQNFTWEALDSAKNAYIKLVNLASSWGSEPGELLSEYVSEFKSCLEDDINIPAALAVVWEMVKSDKSNKDKITTLLDFDRVLGLELKEHISSKRSENQDLDPKVEELIKLREEARSNKDWKEADRIREQLKHEFDYSIVDTK